MRIRAQQKMTDLVGERAPERHAETAFLESDEVTTQTAARAGQEALSVFY